MSAQLQPRSIPTSCPETVRIARKSDAPALFAMVMNGVVKDMAVALVNETKVLHLVAEVLNPVVPASIPRPVVAVIDGPDGYPIAAAPIIPRQWWYSDAWHLIQPWIYVREEHRKKQHLRTLIETATWWSERVNLPMLMIAPAGEEFSKRRQIYSRYTTSFGGSFIHRGGGVQATSKPFNVRVAVPQDYPAVKELALLLHKENAQAPLAPEKLEEVLAETLQQRKGIVGVVMDEQGKIVGCTILALAQWDYSSAWHYSEIFVFIHPDHRHGRYALDLLRFCRWWAEQTGIPVTIGITSKIRTEAKMRLYRRYLEPTDHFYVHDASGSGGSASVQEV